jgi:hypothetical protein
MSRPDDDEEALRWGDQSDPTYTESPVSTPAEAAERAAGEAAEAAGERTQLGSVQLVSYGVLAGIYLLFTVGWAFVVSRTVGSSSVLLATIMFQLGQFLAIAAAPLWFTATFALTRGRRPAVRLTWLLIGAVVLLPLPFVLGV